MEQQAVLHETNPRFLDGKGGVVAGRTKPQPVWRDYLQLTKPGITMSNLMTAFTGLWLAAGGSPELKVLVCTLAGTALVVGSGATLNNCWERELDAKMKRTRHRALAAGRIDPKSALIFGLVLLACGLAVLAAGANMLSAALGLIGYIVYVLLYTPLKRTTTLNTVVGGVSGAIPPAIGWTAVTNEMNPGAWVLLIVVFLWQFPHFLSLAMLKVDDYRAAGFRMLPAVKGFETTKRQMIRYGAALLPTSLLLYNVSGAGVLYLAAAAVLGLIYLVLLIQGLFVKDDLAWARKLFGYSLVYLTVWCAAIIVSAI